MSAETDGIVAYLEATGVPHRVTSTFRPARFRGDTSRHIRGLAVDVAGPTPGWDSPELVAIFKAFEPVEHLLYELILSAAPYNIKDGKRVPKYAVRDHHNHVHLSVDPSVILPLPTLTKDTVMPDNVFTASSRVVNLVPHPSGDGYWIVTETGEVFAFGVCQFFGRVVWAK